MCKKKQCVNCKHREFGWTSIISCNKFNKDVKDEDHCKYYKRDIYIITSSGLDTYVVRKDDNYEWIRGRFRPVIPFWKKDI